MFWLIDVQCANINNSQCFHAWKNKLIENKYKFSCLMRYCFYVLWLSMKTIPHMARENIVLHLISIHSFLLTWNHWILLLFAHRRADNYPQLKHSDNLIIGTDKIGVINFDLVAKISARRRFSCAYAEEQNAFSEEQAQPLLAHIWWIWHFEISAVNYKHDQKILMRKQKLCLHSTFSTVSIPVC